MTYGIIILAPETAVYNTEYLHCVEEFLYNTGLEIQIITEMKNPIITRYGYKLFPVVLIMKNGAVAKTIVGKILPDKLLEEITNLGWVKYDEEDKKYISRTEMTKHESRSKK